MIVLGHRVLIRPDEQPNRTESGLILTEDREWIATSGTVVQVGQGGSLLAYKARQRALKAAIEAIDREDQSAEDGDQEDLLIGLTFARDAVAALLGTADPEPDVQVGDRVAFDADHGLAFSLDGEALLILNQDDIVIIVQEAEEAA